MAAKVHNKPLGKFYKAIEPQVSTKIKYQNENRNKEVTVTRLRFGKCKLNKYLKELNLHPDGECQHCGAQESVEHFLLECVGSTTRDAIEEICNQTKINCNLTNILAQEEICDHFYDKIQTTLAKVEAGSEIVKK